MPMLLAVTRGRAQAVPHITVEEAMDWLGAYSQEAASQKIFKMRLKGILELLKLVRQLPSFACCCYNVCYLRRSPLATCVASYANMRVTGSATLRLCCHLALSLAHLLQIQGYGYMGTSGNAWARWQALRLVGFELAEAKRLALENTPTRKL